MRSMSINALYSKKFKTFPFEKEWRQLFGTPERSGMWLIYGNEKNGKTTCALQLADYLSEYVKTLFISGEEGLGYEFVEACKRAKMKSKKQLQFSEYVTIEELEDKLMKQRSPGAVFIDNITVYSDELKGGKLRALAKRHPNKLFIFIAHEEQNQPYTSTGKLCKKLAKIIIHVEGLQASISGRCPGGKMFIDEEKGKLYWGEDTQLINKKIS